MFLSKIFVILKKNWLTVENFKNLAPIDFKSQAHLPIFEKKTQLVESLKKNQVIIVSGSTGSGKSTQLAKIVLDAGLGKKIAHTQPRRIAARALAERVSHELNCKIGQGVGLELRFVNETSGNDWITFLTDGLLLSKITRDRFLNQYDCIILDEAHERSLNIDFLIAYLKKLIQKRKDLKIIITSATIDIDKFSKHFNNAPIIEVSGKLFPVEINYLNEENDNSDLLNICADTIENLNEKNGDILVFLSGEKEIAEEIKILRKRPHLKNMELLPLYARLSPKKQARVFEKSSKQRVILATNVAETSLTVPNIRFVVDLGLARIKRYAYHQRIERLPIEKISKASANQRAGRCGRVKSGICFRLYTKSDFESRSSFTPPEILRANLANVLLKMKLFNFNCIDFFLESPPPKAWQSAEKTLKELNALNEEGHLTKIGNRLADLPVDVRLGRILLAAEHLNVLNEMLIIVAAISVPNLLDENPQSTANNFEKNNRFTVEKTKSVFMEYLSLWNKIKNNNSIKIKEWQEIFFQLKKIFKPKPRDLKSVPDFYKKIHCAVLTGFLGFVGFKTDERGLYQGVKNLRFYLHPKLNIKAAPHWIVASELIETSRLFARNIAQIEPEWIESVAYNLIQHHYLEPHWEKKSQSVVAYEKITLWGLTIIPKRRVLFEQKDKKLSRQIFIQNALVLMDLPVSFLNRWAFIQNNLKIIQKIKVLEVKQRREDILIDESLIYDFYNAHIAEDVYDLKTFEVWLKNNPKTLHLSQKDLMNHDARGITNEKFPSVLEINQKIYPLQYNFSPNDAMDGVTIQIPLMDLKNISNKRLEWLVPGLIKNKILFLLKSLPQKYRVKIQPLEQFVEDFLKEENLDLNDGILENLLNFMRKKYAFESRGWNLNQELFRMENLPRYFLMNIELIDLSKKTLAISRNIDELKKQFKESAQKTFEEYIPKTNSKENIQSWDFCDLNDVIELEINGEQVIGYPALCFENNRLFLNVFDAIEEAAAAHKIGLLELFQRCLNICRKNLEKNCPNNLLMLFMPLGTAQELKKQWIAQVFTECCLYEPLPKTKDAFLKRIAESKDRINLVGQEMARLLIEILELWRNQKLNSVVKAFPQAWNDLNVQRNVLVHKYFIQQNSWERLKQFPRYLKAMNFRIEKIRQNPERDLQNQKAVAFFVNLYLREIKKNPQNQKLKDFYWLIEELRVSLFAPALKTPMPISIKRLEKIWGALILK